MQADPVDGRGEEERCCVYGRGVRSDVKRADKRAEGTEKVEVEAGGSLLFGGRLQGGRRCCFLLVLAVCTMAGVRDWREEGKSYEKKDGKAAGRLVLHGIEYTGAGTTELSIIAASRLTAWHGCKCCEHGMMTGTGTSSTKQQHYELIGMVGGIDRSRPVGPIHLKMVESRKEHTLASPLQLPLQLSDVPVGIAALLEPPTSAPRHSSVFVFCCCVHYCLHGTHSLQ
jgi:hypothetical protein